jgi:hypothetical protein
VAERVLNNGRGRSGLSFGLGVRRGVQIVSLHTMNENKKYATIRTSGLIP